MLTSNKSCPLILISRTSVQNRAFAYTIAKHLYLAFICAWSRKFLCLDNTADMLKIEGMCMHTYQKIALFAHAPGLKHGYSEVFRDHGSAVLI